MGDSAISEPNAPQEHRTVSRITDILELAAASNEGIRLKELAAKLAAPRSSVHGLVKGLVATGYLRGEAGTYTIGPAISALLATTPRSPDQLARASMERLHDRFNETVMLCSLVGDAVVYVDSIESTNVIRYSAPLRTRRPLYPTSSGKCILAFSPERFRENFVLTHFEDKEQRARVSLELKDVCARGVAINRGETLPDVSGVAVPILAGSQLVSVLAIAGPTTRLSSSLDDIAEAAKAEVAGIASRLTSEVGRPVVRAETAPRSGNIPR